MKLYLVRHGLSEGNVANVHQSEHESLTAEGMEQAQKVAERFRSLAVDVIVSSHAKRTRQTSDAIQKITGAPLVIDENLLEKRGPTQLTGVKHGSEKSKRAHDLMVEHIDDPNYHFADEENNWDFIVRIDKALKALEKREEENVVVVSHGFSIKALTGLMLFGSEFSSRQFELMKYKMETKNTGISIFQYSFDTGWKLITFNDHAHLLE